MEFIQSLDFDFIDFLNFKERPFRAKLIPAKIWKDLDKYKNDSVALARYFRKWKCRAIFMPSKQTKYILVGGIFDIDNSISELHIFVNNFDKFVFSPKLWDRFKYKLIQTLLHEIIHYKQYYGKHENYVPKTVYYVLSPSDKINELREYYSNLGEIEAYGHCIFLDTTIVGKINKSNTYKGILKVFSADYNNHALYKIENQITKWSKKYAKYIKSHKKTIRSMQT